MSRMSLTHFDEYPKEMLIYMRHNGPHFNKKLLKFATSLMYKNGERLSPYSKEDVDAMLESYNIKLKNNQLYDYLYVANMGKADFLNSSIENEEHLAKYIKDVIDDEDAYDGIVFNRWYADISYMGIPVDWGEML